MPLSNREIAVIKGMLARGDRQHDVAAYFGVNGGRIAEIHLGQAANNALGERAHGIAAAAANELPPAGPYLAGRSALKARDTLVALRDLIDEALRDIDLYEQGDGE